MEKQIKRREQDVSMTFDKIITKQVDRGTVEYGIIFGNDKVVFIKAGAGGTIWGYEDRYLEMAHRVHERLGATVICASNSLRCLDMDMKTINWCAKKLGTQDCECYFVGVSDGADQCISLARYGSTKKLLCINPSFVPSHNPTNRLILLSNIEKIFVYGTKDEEGQNMIPALKDKYIPNLEIKTVNGADHRFTGMSAEFISLVDFL